VWKWLQKSDRQERFSPEYWLRIFGSSNTEDILKQKAAVLSVFVVFTSVRRADQLAPNLSEVGIKGITLTPSQTFAVALEFICFFMHFLDRASTAVFSPETKREFKTNLGWLVEELLLDDEQCLPALLSPELKSGFLPVIPEIKRWKLNTESARNSFNQQKYAFYEVLNARDVQYWTCDEVMSDGDNIADCAAWKLGQHVSSVVTGKDNDARIILPTLSSATTSLIALRFEWVLGRG
jgi:hypothetical protein